MGVAFCHARLSSQGVPAKTLIVEMVGTHNHDENATASGKIFSPAGLAVAVRYVSGTAAPTIKGLKAALVAAKVPDVITDAQLRDWLKRRKSCAALGLRDALPASQHVETARSSVANWLEEARPIRSLTHLIVQQPVRIGKDRVFIPMRCVGMLGVPRGLGACSDVSIVGGGPCCQGFGSPWVCGCISRSLVC